MKTLLLFALGNFALAPALCQLKTTSICPPLVVDVLDGRVSGYPSNSTAGQIKAAFPCFTSEETNTSACGAAVFYRDKDLYFYSARNYIQVGNRFNGKFTIPIMGAARNSLFKWLGLPKIKDVKWDAYQTKYGTLVLYYSAANRVIKIQMSTLTSEQMKLCE
jgi:hypothetical protein